MAAIGGFPGQERFIVTARSQPRCPWCRNPNAEAWDERLCRTHEAEYLGLSVAELDRRDREQYAEEADAKGWPWSR